MFLSILLKAYALVLMTIQPAAGIALWVVSLAPDYCWSRSRSPSIRGRLCEILLVNVGALIVGATLHAFFIDATTRWKDGIPLLAHATALLLRAVHVSAGAFGGQIHMSTMAGPLVFPVGLDTLGLLTPLFFSGIGLTYLLFSAPDFRAAARGTGWIAGVVLGAMLLRWVLSTLLFLFLSEFIGYETEELPILPFFKLNLIAMLYAPFLVAAAVILQKQICGSSASQQDAPSCLLPRRPWLLAVLFILAAVVQWEPSGSRKDGEVVINTYHAQWSRTDRPYDKEWYGPAAGYNYACMKRLFEGYYPTRELKTRITPEELETASALVIYDPDRAFTADELSAIHAFVKKGGGILLVGDHTNVFGTTTHLNTVCRPFGFIFRDDVLFDLDEDFFQLYDVPRMHSQFLHGMTFFKFRGPASIQPTSCSTRTIFRVSHAKSLRAIYSVNNFYPPPNDDPKMRTGEFSSSVSSRYGQGRVLAFADSTVFSNFEIFYPGKYEYLLNGMRWLNHSDGPLTTPIKRLAWLAALILLGYLFWRTGHPRRLMGTILAAIVTWSLAWAICIFAEQARAEFPQPAQPMQFMFFATEPDDDPYTLRTFVTEASYDQKYDVFIQWVLRTGMYSGFYLHGPDQKNTLFHMLNESEQTDTGMGLIIREQKHLELLEKLGPGPLSTADHLLLMVSVSTNMAQEDAMASIRKSGVIKEEANLAKVEACWPDGEVRLQEGGRRIAVVVPAEKFSDSQMGFSEKVKPSEIQLERYAEEFELMDWLFGRNDDIVPDDGPSEDVTP